MYIAHLGLYRPYLGSSRHFSKCQHCQSSLVLMKVAVLSFPSYQSLTFQRGCEYLSELCGASALVIYYFPSLRVFEILFY